jgi:hypothetical protein
MRNTIHLVLALALLSPFPKAFAAETPPAPPLTAAEPAKEADFFPLAAGMQWVYKTTHKTKKETFDMTVRVDGPWKMKDDSGTILTQRDKRGQMRQFLVVREDGVFLRKLGLKKSISPEVDTMFTPAMPVLMFPLTPGRKVHWEGRLKVAWVDKAIIFDGEVVGWEEIEVPAGKFKCMRMHFDEKRGEDKVIEDVWYAPGVGQVRYDGGEYIKELKSYTANGDNGKVTAENGKK